MRFFKSPMTSDKLPVTSRCLVRRRFMETTRLMPRWFLWTLVALFSWGVWAVVSKLIGDALSAAHSQALSTLGLLPVMVALGCSRKLSGARTVTVRSAEPDQTTQTIPVLATEQPAAGRDAP